MDLENLLPHKRGTKVSVNGSIYEIDSKGIAHGVKEADAKKLLAAPRSWRLRIERSPVKTAPAAPAGIIPEVVAAPVPEEVIIEVEAPAAAPVEAAAPEAEPEVAAAGAELPDAGEWPDPTEEMDIGYLRQMAGAYGLKTTTRNGKKQLVAMIKKAMYGNEVGA